MTEQLIGDGLVLLDLDTDGVGHLRLNRPEASNGMNVEFLRALHDAILVAHGEPWLRVLLLSGAGPNFCAGGDVKTFASKGADLPDYLRQATSWLQACVQGLLSLQGEPTSQLKLIQQGRLGVLLVTQSQRCALTFPVKQHGFVQAPDARVPQHTLC